jgi:hypothetical protein
VSGPTKLRLMALGLMVAAAFANEPVLWWRHALTVTFAMFAGMFFAVAGEKEAEEEIAALEDP